MNLKTIKTKPQKKSKDDSSKKQDVPLMDFHELMGIKSELSEIKTRLDAIKSYL
jgi:protein involved in ribonucleotide reduction